MVDYDIVVVGGGIVGIAIAYGLTCHGQRVAICDEGDIAYRAARGNFGLIWVQGKGANCRAYADWTRQSASLWGKFNQELENLTNIDIGYRPTGGIDLCLTEESFEARSRMISRMIEESGGAFKAKMLRRKALDEMLPELGPTVLGASFSPMDAHVNPLLLLRSLHTAFQTKGGNLLNEAVLDITWTRNAFELSTAKSRISAKKIVLAAGLGSKNLAHKIGLTVPVYPQRGQILVTERLKRFLNYPTTTIRQTEEGSVQLGDSHEDVGLNDNITMDAMADIAHRARCIFPHLEKANIVRAWGALRILTADGLPVYDHSERYPGAFAVSSHSGITLAAIHALEFAKYVVQGHLPSQLESFSEQRFHVH